MKETTRVIGAGGAKGEGRFVTRHFRKALGCVAGGGMAIALATVPALAQFSAQDGYAADGSPRVQIELTPYLWLPATAGTARLGERVGTDVSFDSGPPTLADLAHSLHGAIVGYGLVRYGPWSGELDVQWIDAFHKSVVRLSGPVPTGTLSETVTLFRIAPGVGYQVYSGDLAGTPTTLDARAGFSVLSWDVSARFENSPLSGADVSRSFVQPWAGFRASLYPGTDWRIEIGAAAEGFGVDGVWGWGASALVSYSINSWLDVTGGIRALASNDRGKGSGVFKRSIDVTAYGPVVGFGFRF